MLQVYKSGVDNNTQAIMNALGPELFASIGSRAHTWSRLLAALMLLACACDAVALASEPAGLPPAPVIAEILAAWNRADAHAIAAQYEANGDFVSPDGMHAEGRQAIQAFYAGAFARGYAGSRATADMLHVRNVTGSIAVVDGSWSIEPTPASKVQQREAGLFFAVLHRHGGRWSIAALREQSSATSLRELDTRELHSPAH
jgi:uncharacterized protein (TIGR02246 family)